MAITQSCVVLLSIWFAACILSINSAFTDPTDGTALYALGSEWKNTPPSWAKGDPCGLPWEGVSCNNSRVTALRLSTMNLKGILSSDIGTLSELSVLDLSHNQGLTSPLPASIGNLKKLTILILTGCHFSGIIPSELGNLEQLTYMALNSNNFTGEIPPSFGNLANLYSLDLANNHLTGSLPISTNNNSGLDLLYKARHFHLNNNQLSGTIPAQLFSSSMALIHILLDSNQLTGSIPSTLGEVKMLEVLRLDRNSLSGSVPSDLSKLTTLNTLHLENNKLNGRLPNLMGMSSLNYLDLSKNLFDASEAPPWFSTLPLTTLVMEHGNLQGQVPQVLFNNPNLQQVMLKNNSFNGTLVLGDRVSSQLQLVDLEANEITSVVLGSQHSNILILLGNPACSIPELANTNSCLPRQPEPSTDGTFFSNCEARKCPADQKLSPSGCECAYPYQGTMSFRAPLIRSLSNKTLLESLKSQLWTQLKLAPDSVSLQNPRFNSDDNLQFDLQLFPATGRSFNRLEIQRLGFSLTSHGFNPPREFGSAYYFIALPYNFLMGNGGSSKSSSGWMIGIVASGAFLVMVFLGIGAYALQQKGRAERAIDRSKRFGSCDAPQLQGTRWFSYEELKMCTNNFSGSNEIGSGGFGKVYRGILPGGQQVAIKRARKVSMDSDLQFRTEIELLSRVHHKNLVNLVGFCFELGEEILVYEFIPNGTLEQSLSGTTNIHLHWKIRLSIALGSARGLSYLHELANPPIIHRDIKSANVLLDKNLTAKVADFGISKLVSNCESTQSFSVVKGTVGYLDPEYYMTQRLTEKSDVYSFGVLMLELVTAKKPIENGQFIGQTVRMAIDKNEEKFCGLKELIDPIIRIEPRLVGFKEFVDLGMRCIAKSAADRPTMSEIVKEIENILQNEKSSQIPYQVFDDLSSLLR